MYDKKAWQFQKDQMGERVAIEEKIRREPPEDQERLRLATWVDLCWRVCEPEP